MWKLAYQGMIVRMRKIESMDMLLLLRLPEDLAVKDIGLNAPEERAADEYPFSTLKMVIQLVLPAIILRIRAET